MSRVLVVAPFSGRKVGGGLATMNEQLTEALSADNDVKMLTVRLPAHSAPDPAMHGRAQIVYIEDDHASRITGPLSAQDKERDYLYDLINKAVEEPTIRTVIGEDWSPDVIIGHSRFSGPAAVKLKRWYTEAKALYLLHSFPVEGTLLTGSGNRPSGEHWDKATAERKIAQEQEWMSKADIAVGVGPLLGAGAKIILAGAKKKKSATRVHELIPGTEVDPDPVTHLGTQPGRPRLELLMIGRASAEIKGLGDVLMAAVQLKDLDLGVDLHIRIRGYAKDQLEVRRVQEFVDEMMVTMSHLGGIEQLHHHLDLVTVLELTESKNVITRDIRSSQTVIMPSYIEHFGLVPFEAAGHGVPILVNEISGVGLFLSDQTRIPQAIGDAFVVRDFDPTTARPLRVTEFLRGTAKHAFDNRPDAWAAAIRELANDGVLETRFRLAKQLHDELTKYTWHHCAKALIDATADQWNGENTVQGPDGTVQITHD